MLVSCLLLFVMFAYFSSFLFLLEKIQKRWAKHVSGELIKVDLERTTTELGGMVTSLGISLAGHKDRSQMATYICGLNPNGKRHPIPLDPLSIT